MNLDGLNFEAWGGLQTAQSYETGIPTSNGVHALQWKNSLIVYRISNSSMISSSKSILVGLNASISARDEKTPPFFTGGGKATNISSPILSISDSTTHEHNVALGWYLGTKKDPDFQRNLADFIESFCLQCEVTPVLFGGSGGGFASVVMGDLVNIETVVVAMNPQTDVLKWHERHVQALYSACWGCSSKEEFYAVLGNHGIISNFNQLQSNEKSDVLILQNLLDDFQMVHHFPIVKEVQLRKLQSIGEIRNIRWFFGIWGPGHFAPWPEHVRASLDIACSNLSTLPITNFLKEQFYPKMCSVPIINPSDISLSGGGMFGDMWNFFYYRARRDLEYEKIPVYNYTFSMHEISDRNLAFCIHSLRQIDFLLMNIEEFEFSVHLAVHHVLAWWKFINSESGNETVMAWYDMSTGLRAQKIALLIALINKIPALEKHRDTLTEIAQEHIRWFEKPKFITKGNHGIFQIHGYMALALALHLEDVKEKASTMMIEIFFSQFTENLVHIENSPEYHHFIISVFDNYFRTNWYGADVSKKLADAKILNYWLLDTDSKYICVGDTEPKSLKLSENIKLQAIQTADITFIKNNHEYHVKSFDITGYLCVKASEPKGNVFFSLSAFPSIRHRQADDLSFVLFDQGRWRFDDPGKYTYQRDKRKYIDKSHQHNCLTVDGKSFSIGSQDIYPSCREGFQYHENEGVFVTSMRWKPCEGVEHIRYCLYAPDEFFVVVDTMESQQEHRYSQWFQIGQSYKEFDRMNSSIQFKTEDSSEFRIEFFSVDPNSIVRTFVGDHEKPVGWISKQYQKLEENLAIEHSVTSNSATLWKISSFTSELKSIDILERIEKLRLPFDIDSLRCQF